MTAAHNLLQICLLHIHALNLLLCYILVVLCTFRYGDSTGHFMDLICGHENDHGINHYKII